MVAQGHIYLQTHSVAYIDYKQVFRCQKKNVLVVLGLELRASHLLHQSFFVLGISEIGSQEQFPGWPQTSILLSFAS
jgi:hypothetical protein